MKVFLLKVTLGAVAGVASYGILAVMRSPWEEVVAALLIGSVAGLVAKDRFAALVGSLSSALGWLVGTLIFSVVLAVGVGAWILAGGFLGLAHGIHQRSLWRASAGLVLGALAGFVAEASRFLTVFSEALMTVDMQLLLLLVAGALLPLAALRRVHRARSDEAPTG